MTKHPNNTLLRIVTACLLLCGTSLLHVQAADVAITTPTGGGFSVTTPADVAPAMRVDGTGLVLQGRLTSSGGATGTRLVFDAPRGALRVGTVVGTEWDAGSTGEYSFAAGNHVKASGYGSFAFGDQVTASSIVGVAFGSAVSTTGTAGFAAGASNTCSGFACTAIGYTVTAGGQGSVALGYRAQALRDYTVALGYRVSTGNYTGSFIFGDASTSTPSESTADNQFMVRAAGGVRLRTSATLGTGCDLPAGSGAFSCTSDRNQKDDFWTVDAEETLAKAMALPVSNWRYRAEPGNVRHIGPMAQDFYASFGLGSSETAIGLGDLSGINLVAIQALAARTDELREKTREVDQLRTELDALRQALQELQHQVRLLR
jgi:hypothetical protein